MPDALQEGTAAPTGVTASVPALPTRISPDHPPTTTPDDPSRATKHTAHQLAPPRSSSLHRCLTMANETGPTETRRRNQEPGAATSAASREGTSSTAPGGIRPDAAQGQTGPPLAQPSPKRAREAPVAALQNASQRRYHPPHESRPRPAGDAASRPGQARPDPDRAQKGLDLGREGPPLATSSPRRQAAAPPPTRHPARRRPGRRAVTGSIVTEEHPHRPPSARAEAPSGGERPGPPPPAPRGQGPVAQADGDGRELLVFNYHFPFGTTRLAQISFNT